MAVITETLFDGLRLFPFLFIAFVIIEYIEHKIKNQNIISISGKFGPIIGGLLGVVPQCGFSVTATNLYATRIITLGTLISIYLSTSDEMLPILIGEGTNLGIILKIILLKVIIGIICGFIIDILFRRKDTSGDVIEKLCEEEHCHCNHGIIFSAFKHTLNTFIFLLIITFMLNMCFEYLGEDLLSKIFMKNNLFAPFISSLIGLIPSCASSIALTELYISNAISFGSAMAGLLTGSGVALIVLFKTNKNMKDNLKIISILYCIGVISGIIINMIK